MSPGLSQLAWEPSLHPFPWVPVSPQGQLGDSPCTPSPGCRCPRGSSPHPAPLPFLPAQALSLTGAQPSQLTLDPPWTPVFLPEKVTLTCRGSSAPGPTDWYVNEQFWQQARSNHIHITRDLPGSYSLRCHSPGAGLSPSITLGFSNAAPQRALPLPGHRGPHLPRVAGIGTGDGGSARAPPSSSCRLWGCPTRGTTPAKCRQRRPACGNAAPRSPSRCAVSVQEGWGRTGALQPSLGPHIPPQVLPPLPASPHPSPHSHMGGIPPSLPRSLPGIPSCLPRSPHSFPGPFPGPHMPPRVLPFISKSPHPCLGPPHFSLGSLHPSLGLPDPSLLSLHVAQVPPSLLWSPFPAWVPPSLPGVPSIPLQVVPPFPRSPIPAHLLPAGVPVSGVSLVAQPPGGQVAEGDRLVLSCSVAEGTGPLSFSWHRQGSAVPLATGPYYKLRTVQHQDSGRYHCTATNGGTVADSPPLWVTVLVPVAGATITMARMEPVVPVGENLNLSCSVREGTAPVTFTWLRDGQELDSGPVLSLGTVGPAHAGTYQCLATNRLGTHRIFRARSLALALAVTQLRQGGQQQGTAMAVGLSVSLLLLLLLTAAMGWYLRRRRRAAAGKSQRRDPTVPLEPEGRQPEPTAPPGEPEDGEVLYIRVVVTERDGGNSPSRSPRGSPRSAPPREPPVTYAVLPGPHARLRLPSDTYENVP
ncbi:arginine-glutamic acid dipeptide repeats protein-like isoform X3 [Harpia harpyja]|uniref:arginine-glutamic acid dipeptide repeats protein-like isoform X3 n=1 Tax=Harpia harpyja TaxID=202280 RepID=UPI0022B17E40|nr:arginine-glutamic acid dipeptide repeats protein-like isoform X3 [Harpia harpyja]